MKVNKNIFSLILILLSLGAFISIFYLPFYIKPFEIIVSPSCDYGFNNNIAILSIMFFMFLISSLLYKYKFNDTAAHKPFFMNIRDTGQGISVKHLFAIIICYAIAIYLLYFLTGDLKRYGESSYYFDKIDRILIGQIPYLDFEYAYGPLFLYLPVFLFRFLKPLIDIKASYYIVYTFLTLLGLYFIFYLINRSNLTKRQKLTTFYLITIPGYPLAMGFNCTFFRFLSPYISIFLLNNLVTSDKINNRKLFIIILSIALLFINVSISPEIGLVFLISLLLYLILLTIFYRKDFIFILLFFIFFSTLITFIVPRDFILIAKALIKGGFNFPVVPSPSILLYLVSLFLIVPIQIARYVRYKTQHLVPVLLFISILMIPAALGMCDTAHVFNNGIGLFLLSFIYAAHISKLAFRIYSIVFLIVFCLVMNFAKVNYYKEDLMKIIFNKVELYYPSREKLIDVVYNVCKITGMDKADVKNKIEGYFLSNDIIFSHKLDKYEKIAAPFNIHEKIYRYLLDNNKYVPEYYNDLSNVFIMEQVQIKLSQLKDNLHKIILIKDTDLNYNCDPMDWRKTISLLCLYSFNRKPIRNTRQLYLPLFNYIRKNYRIIEKIGIYNVMERI